MQRYAFTIKDNRKEQSDYYSTFDQWEKKGCIIRCKYAEQDSQGKLHYHGIVSIPEKCYRKALCPKGMHFMLKEIYDESGWDIYIKKDQKDLDEDKDTNDNELMGKLNRSLFSLPKRSLAVGA